MADRDRRPFRFSLRSLGYRLADLMQRLIMGFANVIMRLGAPFERLTGRFFSSPALRAISGAGFKVGSLIVNLIERVVVFFMRILMRVFQPFARVGYIFVSRFLWPLQRRTQRFLGRWVINSVVARLVYRFFAGIIRLVALVTMAMQRLFFRVLVRPWMLFYQRFLMPWLAPYLRVLGRVLFRISRIVVRTFLWLIRPFVFLQMLFVVFILRPLMYGHRRQKILVLTLLVTAVGALMITFRLGTGVLHYYKEHIYASRAEDCMKTKDYVNASLWAYRTLQINPKNITVTRILGDAHEAWDVPTCLLWRSRLADLEPNATNQLLYAYAAFHFQRPPFVLASQILTNIDGSARTSAPFYKISAALASRLGDNAKAAEHLEKLVAMEPTNDWARASLAAVRLSLPGQAQKQQARQMLEEYLKNPKVQPVALRALAIERASVGDQTAALAYSRQVISGTNVGFSDYVNHLELLEKFRQPELPVFLESVKKQASRTTERISDLATWMNLHHMPKECRTWLEGLPSGVLRSPPIQSAMAESLMQLKDWLGLIDFLRQPNWGRREYVRLALVTYAGRQLGHAETAELNWEKAIKSASKDPTDMDALAKFVLQWNWEKEALSVWWAATKQHPDDVLVLGSLEQYYLRRGQTADLLRVYSEKFRRRPQDAVTKNNVAAICLLLNQNMDVAYRMAQQAYERSRHNGFLASTYAYSLHCQGKNELGIGVMRKLDAETLAQPTVSVYYGLLLADAGEKTEAAKYLARATNAQLLPEERQLVERAQRKL